MCFPLESLQYTARKRHEGFSVEPSHLCHFTSHRCLASPVAPWERLKIGAGAPPVLTRHGWLLIYHGVSEIPQTNREEHHLRYSVGAMILSKKDPRRILYRSSEPVLTPDLPQERIGTVGNVVFPTGIDRRDDLGKPDRFDSRRTAQSTYLLNRYTLKPVPGFKRMPGPRASRRSRGRGYSYWNSHEIWDDR